MGRVAKYTEQDILDAALELVASDGAHAASVVAIAGRLGAPSGSIYHRFPSRDLILATLWLRTVRRFQQGFLEAFLVDDAREVAQRAVLHTLEWTTAHPEQAMVLAMYRREDLIALWPQELGAELSTLNDDVRGALMQFAGSLYGSADSVALGKTRFALIEIPYAAVRQSMRGHRPPWLASSTLAASLAVLGLAGGASPGVLTRLEG